MEVIGWAGTTLVIIAYYPQIQHLIVQKCAWGISILTWVMWLLSAAMLLAYAIFRNDPLFTVVQLISILAIAVTIFLAKRSNTICPYHLGVTLEKAER